MPVRINDIICSDNDRYVRCWEFRIDMIEFVKL
jgi:hypothetical protein